MLSPGDIIGPYTIRERAGQGGMAIVYKAWHNGLHRLEALKVPRGAGQTLPDSAYIARLLAEARVAAGLHHPHIVGIHGVSEPLAPIPYFAMDWVEGRDLSQILAQKGAFSLRETTQILEKVALALDYAHSRGVVHRDIKPANILLSDEAGILVPKVVDFGISRAAEDEEGAGETKLTRSGMIVGTPEYMSPEQAGSGERVDFRTDIYSLGIVAYEMLCGAPPFTAGLGVSRLSILISQVRDTAPLWEKFPAFPPVAGDAILRALAKSPADRPISCTEFIAELGAALGSDDADWTLKTVSKNPGDNQSIASNFATEGEIERTPFDAPHFDRDESATIFERPISLSDTPPPGPPPTLLPQFRGAETALETPVEAPTSAGFSLRARLEAAKNDDSKNAVAPRLAENPTPAPNENRLQTARDDASIAPEIGRAGVLANHVGASERDGFSSAPPARILAPNAPRTASRIAVFAGFGGVLVGGALVLALSGRSANLTRPENGAPRRASAAITKSAAPLTTKNVAPAANRNAVSNAPTPNSAAAPAPSSLIEIPPVAVAPGSAPRLRTVKVVRNSPIAFETTTRRSSRRAAGTESVVQRGQNGTRQTTLQITYQGEREMTRRTLSQLVTRQPIEQITVIGTRENVPTVRSNAPSTEAPRVRSSRFRTRATQTSEAPRARKTTRAAPRPVSEKRAPKARTYQRPRAVREAPLPP